jgi:hypothetical protein
MVFKSIDYERNERLFIYLFGAYGRSHVNDLILARPRM